MTMSSTHSNLRIHKKIACTSTAKIKKYLPLSLTNTVEVEKCLSIKYDYVNCE